MRELTVVQFILELKQLLPKIGIRFSSLSSCPNVLVTLIRGPSLVEHQIGNYNRGRPGNPSMAVNQDVVALFSPGFDPICGLEEVSTDRAF